MHNAWHTELCMHLQLLHAHTRDTSCLHAHLLSMLLHVLVAKNTILALPADLMCSRAVAFAHSPACAAATSIPIFLGFATKSLALCWVLQAATLALAAYTMALLPAICSNLYPAGVRISGFNFACNVGMMVFGGLVSAGRGMAGIRKGCASVLAVGGGGGIPVKTPL
jgi:hypothetical protein